MPINQLVAIFKKLPKDLQNEAKEWGMNDTLWRDKFIEYFEKNQA